MPLERMAARSPDGKTPGKRDLAVPMKFTPDRTVPESDIELTGRGQVEWERIWRSGWWLNRDQDYHWVEMIVRAYMDIEEWRKQIAEDGLTVEGWNGQLAAHPLIKSINTAQLTIQKCLQVLGFSPTDRAKLAIKQNEARSALAEMIAASQE